MNGLLTGISSFLETAHHSQRLERCKEAKFLEDKDDPLKIPKSNELGLGYSVQDTAANNSKFSPVVDILYADYHPPMPERPFSFVFKGEYTSCFERTACTKINKTY